MSRLIDADALKRKYEVRKRLFCRNRIEFSILSDKDKARVDELDNCIADILNTPTIEPECKKGKWMQTENMNIFECSCCHSRWNVYYVCDFDYCPHCGTKMEDEK